MSLPSSLFRRLKTLSQELSPKYKTKFVVCLDVHQIIDQDEVRVRGAGNSCSYRILTVSFFCCQLLLGSVVDAINFFLLRADVLPQNETD
jgi:hypothetical protein